MSNDPFFKNEVVRQLATILNDTHLTEIEYEVEGCRIRVARQVTLTQPNFNPTAHHTVAPNPIAPSATASETPAAEIAPSGEAVKSPMVGTSYMAATPGSTPFVKMGDRVTKGQTLLIIEAMKVMNQIKAPKDGVVKQIAVKDGDPIEYGQTLIVLD